MATLKFLRDKKAVSPVIGVMLMLVVAIILAAVVSSYAGSLAEGEKKAPQASFDVKFSQSDGLRVIHAGGDVLQGKDTKIRLEYTEAWGSGGYVGQGATIPQANITHLNTNTPFAEGVTFKPGDVAIVTPDKIPPARGGDFTSTTDELGILNPDNVGKTLKVIIIDENSGKPVYTTVVPIDR